MIAKHGTGPNNMEYHSNTKLLAYETAIEYFSISLYRQYILLRNSNFSRD